MGKAPRAEGSARREDKSVRLRLLLWAVLTALTFGVTDLGRPAEDMLRTGRNVLRQHDASGDIVVVAGKGHETGQEIDGVTHPFDDREVVRTALASQ